MIVDHIVEVTDARRTGSDKFLGHCPAHGSQHHRDLSVRVTSDRILLHCFAGCELKSIASALGLTTRDLFLNSNVDHHELRKQQVQRNRARQRQETVNAVVGLTIDACREADYFIRSRQGVSIANWSFTHLDAELNALADAYALLEHEDLDGVR